MPKKIVIERTPCGQQQFVLRRRHSHHHRHGEDDCEPITRDEMNNLLDRERHLREANEALSRENHALKANWQTCEQELRRLQGWVPQLQARIRNLECENHKLRHSLDGNGDMSDQLREMRMKYTRSKNENEGLRQTMRHLKSQIQELVEEKTRKLRHEIAQLTSELIPLRRSYDELYSRYSRLRRDLDTANDKNADLAAENGQLCEQIRVYERALRRHRLL